MIALEPFQEHDFDNLINWVDSRELLHNWSGSLFSFPLTRRSLQWYIDDTNGIGESDAFVYKAVDKTDGNAVGHISLGSISWSNKSARITRVLIGDKNYLGKGICRQMVEAISKIGFETLGLHRISLGVYQNNLAAVSCYKKAGYVEEGVSRDIFLHEGSYWSMVEMAMLEDEWKAKMTKDGS